MAKQAKDGGSTGSDFDFSKFLDLDEEDSALAPSTDTAGFDYNTIPHAKDEIVTGALELDLEATVDSYIKAGKVSWGDKRTLRRLAGENRDLEDNLKNADRAIADRADGYHAIVSNILRKKNDLESFALEDQDPYDAEPVEREEESLGSRAARIRSSDLFREIEKLELHRGEINGKRIGILEEIREIAERQNNDSFDELDDVISLKLEAILRVQDITKAGFTPEDEAVFDRGVEELTGYMQGDYNPLAEEEEYDDFHDETALSRAGHSEDELETIRAAAGAPMAEPSGGNPFGSGATAAPANDFSSEESPEALFAAFGADTFDPEPQTEDEDIADPEDVEVEDVQAEISEDQAEISDEQQLKTPTELISVVELAELEEFASDSGDSGVDEEPVAVDLSASEFNDTVSDEAVDSLAESAVWDLGPGDADLPPTHFLDEAPDELASATVDSDKLPEDEPVEDYPEALERFEGEGGPAVVELEDSSVEEFYAEQGFDDVTESPADGEPAEITQSYAEPVAIEDLDPSLTPVRAVIFEELKAKYGLSFGFEDKSTTED